jgi:phage/plasmid-like protein (TIGR03299 family)
MPAEIESGVFARETPWHGIGVVTPDALTAADAIKLGGLDWEVEKQPIAIKQPVLAEDGTVIEDEYKYVDIENRFALTRDIDQQVMAIVSDVYNPFQNREAFTFMDNLVDSGDAKYETALSLRGGRVVALTMHVPMDVMINGEDRHEAYLLLRTTHDGSGRISVYVVMVRVVCMNTLTLAISGASHSWGVTHTADVRGKISEARDSLGMTFKYAEEFKKVGNRLTGLEVTDDEIIKFLEKEMPIRAKRDDEIEGIVETMRTSDNIANYRGTAWGALNAMSEYQEHVKRNRSGEALLVRTLDGQNAKLRTAFTRRMLARV